MLIEIIYLRGKIDVEEQRKNLGISVLEARRKERPQVPPIVWTHLPASVSMNAALPLVLRML